MMRKAAVYGVVLGANGLLPMLAQAAADTNIAALNTTVSDTFVTVVSIAIAVGAFFLCFRLYKRGAKG